jgi:SAM-dependent methyltransferase
MLDVARAKLANGVARRRPAQAESAHPPEAPHVTLAAGQRGQGAHPVELSSTGVDFRAGDLAVLPVETAAFDLAVCALALAMCRDIQRPISELARAVKPGGLVVISDIHPVSVLLGDSLLFETPGGGRGVTQQYVRWPGEWIDAFNAAGLRVQRCIDVPWPGPPFGGEWYAPDGELRSPGQLMGDISILAKEGTPAAIVWQLERL